MRKTRFLALLLPIILLWLAGNRLFALVSADTIPLEAHQLYTPEEVGMHSSTLKRIEKIVSAGMKARAFPGCQVFIIKDGKQCASRF